MRKLITLLLSTSLLAGCTSSLEPEETTEPTAAQSLGADGTQTSEPPPTSDECQSEVSCLSFGRQQQKFRSWSNYFQNYWTLMDKQATTECNLEYRTGIYIISSTDVVLEGEGQDKPNGLSLDWIRCWQEVVEMPDTIIARIENTSAIQGVVSDSWQVWDGFATISAEWTFHPSSGLFLSASIDSYFFTEFDSEKHVEALERMEELFSRR